MRGEHGLERRRDVFKKGSSPLARGALLSGVVARMPSGIIPACAGSTTEACSELGRCRDHPRLRGEHERRGGEGERRGGSSPLARGALDVLRAVEVNEGIIPACAGSTAARREHHLRAQDHPRLRGEHPSWSSPALTQPGSSPLARGARRDGTDSLGSAGIIPACAGSTCRVRHADADSRDHPRLRGEHCGDLPGFMGNRGSSPLARGAHVTA